MTWTVIFSIRGRVMREIIKNYEENIKKENEQ